MDIIVDCDCTVIDFVGGILRIAGNPDRSLASEYDWFMTAYGDERAERIRWLLDYDSDYWQNLPALPGAQEGVADLREQGHNIIWVTKPYPKKYGWESDRRIWLNEFMGANLHNEPIIFSGDKYLIHADAMIDDTISMVENWERDHPTGLGLIFGSEANRQSGFELVDWEDIMQMRFFKRDKFNPRVL